MKSLYVMKRLIDVELTSTGDCRQGLTILHTVFVCYESIN